MATPLAIYKLFIKESDFMEASNLYLHFKILPKQKSLRFSLLLFVYVSSSLSFSVFFLSFLCLLFFLSFSFPVFLAVFSPKLSVSLFRLILVLFSLNFLLSSLSCCTFFVFLSPVLIFFFPLCLALLHLFLYLC